jgi:hypothetical protein
MNDEDQNLEVELTVLGIDTAHHADQIEELADGRKELAEAMEVLDAAQEKRIVRLQIKLGRAEIIIRSLADIDETDPGDAVELAQIAQRYLSDQEAS